MNTTDALRDTTDALIGLAIVFWLRDWLPGPLSGAILCAAVAYAFNTSRVGIGVEVSPVAWAFNFIKSRLPESLQKLMDGEQSAA